MTITPSDVVAFWTEAGPSRWFAKDEAFDADFRRRFHDAHVAAARREMDEWASTSTGSLALLILLDQFPRNSFRGTGHAFATDPLARMFARRALAAGHDLEIPGDIRRFFYLPLQHSEDPVDQAEQVELFRTRMERSPGDRWAEHHQGIITRFGRFPHRNAALGRETTAEEQAFLDQDGFGG